MGKRAGGRECCEWRDGVLGRVRSRPSLAHCVSRSVLGEAGHGISSCFPTENWNHDEIQSVQFGNLECASLSKIEHEIDKCGVAQYCTQYDDCRTFQMFCELTTVEMRSGWVRMLWDSDSDLSCSWCWCWHIRSHSDIVSTICFAFVQNVNR